MNALTIFRAYQAAVSCGRERQAATFEAALVLRLQEGVTMKRCRDCNRIKPYGDFYAGHGYSDGRQPYCKACMNQRSANWQRNNRQRTNEYRNKWRAEHIEEQRPKEAARNRRRRAEKRKDNQL